MNVKRASPYFSNCSVPKKKRKSTTKDFRLIAMVQHTFCKWISMASPKSAWLLNRFLYISVFITNHVRITWIVIFQFSVILLMHVCSRACLSWFCFTVFPSSYIYVFLLCIRYTESNEETIPFLLVCFLLYNLISSPALKKEVGSVIINVLLFRGWRKRPPSLSIFHKFFGVKEHKK